MLVRHTQGDWLLFGIARGLPVPALQGVSIRLPEKVASFARPE
jgi:hypothetical protein